MTKLRTLLSRILALFTKNRGDADLNDEIQAHLDMLATEHVRGSLPPAAARAAARREFGGVDQMKEIYRDQRGLPFFDTLAQDFRYAVRQLGRNPGFTSAVVLTLALGIGANAAVFNLLEAILLKPLPVSNPQELVVFAAQTGGETDYAFSYRLFQVFRASGQLRDVLASGRFRVSIDVGGGAEPTIAGQLISGNYYTLLGVRPALGRLLLPDDDGAPGVRAVAVLSDGYWRRRFGRDPGVVGKLVRLNGYPFTIVGVAAPEFFGTRVGESPDVTVPLAMQMQAMPDRPDSLLAGDGANQFWLELMGRPRSDVPEAHAEAALRVIFDREMADLRAHAGPKAAALGSPRLALEAGSTGLSDLRRRFSRPLMVLAAVVALVLLVACANVANLLLARAAARRREMAVRVALGAGRARLVRQLLTENLVLACLSGGVGLLLAWWTSGSLSALVASDQFQSLDAHPDLRVLVFTLGISLATGLVFGVAPAWRACGIDPNTALKERGDRGSGRRWWFSAGAPLVVAQVAVSLVLLVGAGLFVRTLMNLRNLDLGFETAHVLTLRLEPQGSNQKRSNQVHFMELYAGLLERVRALPGVRAASLTGATPLGNENPVGGPIAVPGYVPHQGEDMRVGMMQIYPGYFSTLGIPVLAGREFDPADNITQPPRPPAPGNPIKVVVNKTMANRFFSGSNAVGREFNSLGVFVYQIIGVVEDAHERGLRDAVSPIYYAAYTNAPTGRGQMTLVVRTTGDPHQLVPTVRQLAREIDVNMPMLNVETIAERVEASTRQEGFVALLAGVFGALALLMAAIGLYGVMSYTVARRTNEIGIRMALGAGRSEVLWMVLRGSLGLIAAGLAIGLPLALGASRLVAGLLFGLQATDPATMAAAIVVMTAVGATAGYVPARRAADVAPTVALRHE